MEKKNKILFVLSNLGNGGAQRTVLNILNNIDLEKFSPTLCIFNNPSDTSYLDLLRSSIRVKVLNTKARFSVFKLIKEIRSQTPDLVFSTLGYVNFVVFVAHLLSFSKSKLILREASFKKKGYNTTKLEYYLVRLAYRNCDVLISLSDGVRQHLIEHYGIKREKIRVVYNPVDIDRIEQVVNDGEILIPRKPGVFRIIACGRLEAPKNYELLIHAVSKLNTGLEFWELHILGDGEKKGELQQLVKDLGLESNIRFLGFQKNPYSYIKGADLFILSSRWEGFPNVIVEAMTCGVPVLATDCLYGPNVILENGKHGWLVPNEDEAALTEKTDYLIRNQQELLRIKNSMPSRVQEFNAKKIIKEYEKLFLEV